MKRTESASAGFLARDHKQDFKTRQGHVIFAASVISASFFLQFMLLDIFGGVLVIGG